MADVRGGLFTELTDLRVVIDVYRRALQRAYVQQLILAMDGGASAGDMPALSRAELVEIAALIKRAERGVDGPAESAHLALIKAEIDIALFPNGH